MSRLLLWAVLVMAALVFAGWPASLWFQRAHPPAALGWPVIAAALLAGAAVVGAAGALPRRWLQASAELLARGATPLWAALVSGMLLRVLAAWVLAPEAASDGAVYLTLARRLADGQPYSTPLGLAYWPPGMPLLLAPLIKLTGSTHATLLLYSLACFAGAAIGAWRLARHHGLGALAVLPAWLLALWPTHVLCTALPEKELLVLALLPWIVWQGELAFRGSLKSATVAGLLLGAAVLTQPSLQLLPLAGALVAWLVLRRFTQVVAAAAVMVVAMIAVVSPWTARNHQVLGAPVMVSTNGGWNLYRVNNGKATGGYMPEGEVELARLDELSRDREGKRLAVEWIAAHPAAFARLAAGKLLLFSGDDSYGAYVTLRPALAKHTPAAYAAGKLLVALPWLAAWLWVAWALRRGLAPPVHSMVLLLPYCYLLAIHAVFESNGKYHLPALAPLLVGLALVVQAVLGRAPAPEVEP